jgi:hypothetical protein
MEFLSTEIIFGLSVRDIGIGLLVLWVLWGPIQKLFAKKGGRVLMKKKCRGCNWVGPAGEATKRCPKCRGPLISME